MSIYSKFYFRPAKGEQMSTVIAPENDESACICGRVVDGKQHPVSDALVLLFSTDEDTPRLLGSFCTDSDGHFLFGPLAGERLYLIKVYKNSLKLRELEVRAD